MATSDRWRPLFHRALRAYLTRVRPSFVLGDRRYDYFWHDYNMTWRNERCVEVPIARAELTAAAGRRVLEVGNVLSHYQPVAHDILDKYERAPGVWNQDVIDFAPAAPYDLIISLSTLEHVGWDETARDPDKSLRALHHLRDRCLAPGGRMLVTFPLGHHPALDQAYGDGRLPFAESYTMLRQGRFTHWRQATWPEVRSAKYGSPYPFANAIVIGMAVSSANPATGASPTTGP